LIKLGTVGLLLAAVSPGCGGKADSQPSGVRGHTYSVRANTTVTTAEIEKAEYQVQANTICKISQGIILKRLADYRAEQGHATKAKKLIAGAIQMYFLPAIEFQFDGLYGMGAPSGDEDQVEEMIGTMQYAIETGQKGGISSMRVSSANQLTELFQVFNRLAWDYGIDRCTVDKSHYGPLWTAEKELRIS
jgi:hypothetical protein